MRRLKKRSKPVEDVDLDMVPIMNMFLVLIPFLLMSASFFHLKAINTSVPVLSSGESTSDAAKMAKVTVIVEIKEKSLCVSALSEEVDEETIAKIDETISKANDAYPFEQLLARLKAVKASYPASDTLILIPEDGVLYDTIIRTMDVARQSAETPLFPNVVLSGKLT